MKRYLQPLFFLLLTTISNYSLAQQTVGLFTNGQAAYNGYTLFAPMSSNNTYLINNCGEMVHSWESFFRPGLAVYLLENGDLLRTNRTNNSTFGAGGSGGRIEMLNWDSNVVWNYTISSTTECQHHDVEYLPNGNILAIVWDSYTAAEAAQAGRAVSPSTLWADKIVEIQPDLVNGGGTIVWEWKAWDHLVQEYDGSKDNYGVVAGNPQLIHINYSSNLNNEDWLHINGVDYNADLDQIVLSVHALNEIWIIDHSTTTAEAAGHTGGMYGKGGDLLYRWGNPIVYQQGTQANQRLFKQHDAKWIPEGYPDAGKISVFNNQAGANVSAVNIIDPPIDLNGNYTYTGGAFMPTGFHWTYYAPNPSDFYATNISGAHRLPNGNTLICEGPSGRFFEVDMDGTTVWEYVNPVSGTEIFNQGTSPDNTRTFRAERYAADYAGLAGRDLTPQGYIESGSTFDCEIFIARIKVILEGAYDASSGMMRADLGALLPLEQPFNRPPWNYAGTELLSNIPNNMVDWILLEVRDANNNNQILAQKAAILLNDGDIVDNTRNYKGVRFDNLDASLSYHFVVRTRNHLAVISETAIMAAPNVLYDFTNPAIIRGGNTQLSNLGGGNYGLIAGDYNSDGIISVADFNGYLIELATTNQYVDSDFNSDGVVTVNDYNTYVANASKIGVSIVRY